MYVKKYRLVITKKSFLEIMDLCTTSRLRAELEHPRNGRISER